MKLFDDDDDGFLSATPKDNFFQVIRTANQNIVEKELDKLMERLAVAEKMLEDRGLEEEYEKQVKVMPLTNSKEIEDIKNSLYIETVGHIVTQCE